MPDLKKLQCSFKTLIYKFMQLNITIAKVFFLYAHVENNKVLGVTIRLNLNTIKIFTLKSFKEEF